MRICLISLVRVVRNEVNMKWRIIKGWGASKYRLWAGQIYLYSDVLLISLIEYAYWNVSNNFCWTIVRIWCYIFVPTLLRSSKSLSFLHFEFFEERNFNIWLFYLDFFRCRYKLLLHLTFRLQRIFWFWKTV